MLLPLQLSVIRILLLISVWFLIRKHRRIFAGATVTVLYWYVFRLGWAAKTDMCTLANPLEADSHYDTTQKQTVEMRSPDGSADLYQLLAGLAVACRHGFEIENALDIAEKTYVNVNIHQKENEDKLKALAQLPDSCAASADCLEQQRAIFEQYHVFSSAMVDGIISKLAFL